MLEMNIQKIIIELLKVATMICLFSILAFKVFTVLLRGFFNLGFFWVDELLVFFQINLVFFVLPILFLNDRHLKIDFLINKFPLSVRKIIDKLIILLTLIYGLIVIYSNYLYNKRSWYICTPNLGIPNGIYYLGILIGMIFIVVFAIKKLFLQKIGGD